MLDLNGRFYAAGDINGPSVREWTVNGWKTLPLPLGTSPPNSFTFGRTPQGQLALFLDSSSGAQVLSWNGNTWDKLVGPTAINISAYSYFHSISVWFAAQKFYELSAAYPENAQSCDTSEYYLSKLDSSGWVLQYPPQYSGLDFVLDRFEQPLFVARERPGGFPDCKRASDAILLLLPSNSSWVKSASINASSGTRYGLKVDPSGYPVVHLNNNAVISFVRLNQ